MWPFARQKTKSIKVDLHSHLIPGIDDGVQDLIQSLAILKRLEGMGYQKVITTPHIHPRYPNTEVAIMEGLKRVQDETNAKGVPIEIEAAAEYFVDDAFKAKVEADEPLLFFGDKYVLVETSFINRPIDFEQIMFHLMSKGYRPVFAHPERYQYLEGDIEWLVKLKNMGVALQVTLNSFVGYYGDVPKKVAEELLSRRLIDFYGSDLHRITQLEPMQKAVKLPRIQRSIRELEIKNDQLL